MAKRKTPLELGKRERQIVETVVRLGEASVAEVLAQLENPPSYSAVRAMLGFLVDKKWLKFRRDGKRYLYRSAADKEKSRRTAVVRMLETFFAGSPTDVLASLLDASAAEITDEEFKRMSEMIELARKERK